MQSFIRVLNVVLAPVLTLYFALKFAGLSIGNTQVGDILAGMAAGLAVLAVEIGVSKGPRFSAPVRRLLDSRAAFEGVWVQEVYLGQAGNDYGIFLFQYLAESDSYSVHGHAYSSNGKRWARWKSTNLFFNKQRHQVTYLWEGELLESQSTPANEKSGLTRLELRHPGALRRPMSGEGDVSHLLEGTRVKFRLRRVSNSMLRKLGLPFTLRRVWLDADGEESQLIHALLARQHATSSEERPASLGP